MSRPTLTEVTIDAMRLSLSDLEKLIARLTRVREDRLERARVEEGRAEAKEIADALNYNLMPDERNKDDE
jgi:hypothetical protein